MRFHRSVAAGLTWMLVLRLDDGRVVVAAVTVTGDSVCRATNVDARVDTEFARAFLAGVPGLVLP